LTEVPWVEHWSAPFCAVVTHMPLVICPMPCPQSEFDQSISPVLVVSPLAQLPYQLNEVSGLEVCPWITWTLACCRFDSWVSTPSSTCGGIGLVPPPCRVGSGNNPFEPCGV
jgi:hypothetical protein